MPIIAPIPRGERRLMQKAIHKTRDKNHARRLTAMLMLHRGERVSDVARTLCCARSSVGRWINWFTHSGIEGLKSLPAGRSRRWPFEHICTLLRELIKHSPGDFGYQGVVCGRGRNPTLRLWPTIFSGKIDVFPGDRRSRLISSMTSVAPA
ncbi:helix-turn-helix domain-containing protein (plasmid) [Klebsiella pneumoniae]|nr:helix-turn-helix domain-containing protein [Klebsiella pneumoniae]